MIASYHPQSLSHHDIEHIISQESSIEDRLDILYNTFTPSPPSDSPDSGALKGSSPTKKKPPYFFKEKAGNSKPERKSSTSAVNNHKIFYPSKKTKIDSLKHDQKPIADPDKPLPKKKP